MPKYTIKVNIYRFKPENKPVKYFAQVNPAIRVEGDTIEEVKSKMVTRIEHIAYQLKAMNKKKLALGPESLVFLEKYKIEYTYHLNSKQ